MDTTRFILIASLCLVALLLWDAWQRDYGEPLPAEKAASTKEGDRDKKDIPLLPAEEDNKPLVENREYTASRLITITNGLFNIRIDTRGGNVVQAELPGYPLDIDQPDIPVTLLDNVPGFTYIVQGGLLGNNEAPAHDAEYSSPQFQYSLADGQEKLEVPLYWESTNGMEVKKIFVIYRDKYVVDIRYEVSNRSNNHWTGRAYGQIQHSDVETKLARTVYTYTGAVISSPEKRYEKIPFDDMRTEKLDKKIVDGWAAVIQHYFVTALIPGSREDEYRYYSLFLDKNKTGDNTDRFVIGATTPQLSIPAGSEAEFKYQLYIGPKLQHRMESLAPGLELTVDYGALWFIAKPLFWCLEKFHGFTGNWGWSIVLVTLMLKILFYNLSAAGYRSMARMRKVQPKLLAIKDRYKNDRTRLNKAMMDLYKEEKINPLGGCFPILVQIPVFIALYWVLLESVELRQTGFIFWIRDLSGPDPYFVLPVIMGVTMLIQQKLNPAPMDPVQEKVMMTLPFIFTIFFAFFPSGLVLYWVVNNILSIAQQWLITRNLERAGLKS